MCPKKSHPKACPSSQTQPQPPPPLPPQELPNIWTFLPTNKNFSSRSSVDHTKSPSLDRNLWTEHNPRALLELHPFPHLAPLTSHLMNCFLPLLPQPKEKVTLLLKKNPSRHEGEEELSIKQIQQSAALCSVELEAVGDFQLRKALKPLLNFEKVQNLNVSNPTKFRSAAMVTTFVRSAGDRARDEWKFLNTVCQADTGMKLAELEHSSFRKCIPYCSGRVPVLVHPSLYRSLKLQFPIDVGGITRDNRVTTELGTGSLRQAVGILTPKDFRPIVASV